MGNYTILGNGICSAPRKSVTSQKSVSVRNACRQERKGGRFSATTSVCHLPLADFQLTPSLALPTTLSFPLTPIPRPLPFHHLMVSSTRPTSTATSVISSNDAATSTVIDTATTSTADPPGPLRTVDGLSLLSKGKEKSSGSDQPEIHFPIGRAPSYFDYYPRQMTLQQRHGRATSSHRSDLSPISNVANVAVTRFSGRSDPLLSPSSSTHNDDLVLKTPPRRRPRRVAANRSSSENRSEPPHLRISDSSSFTQIETPPQTPIDLSTHRAIFDPFSVVVSAPIPGVETMDALVDGMNSFAKDDFFMGSGGISSRSTRTKERFHPLHQPPLPTPPPGVTLGGGLARTRSSTSRASHHDDGTDADNDADEDDDARPRIIKALAARQSSRSKVSRPTSPAVASLPRSRDCTPPPSPQPSRSDTRSVRSVTPSISDIIRAYAPPQQQTRSRPPTVRDSLKASSHGHETVYEEQESEPEPVSAAEEAELVSRTSVDSIAEEVRMTLRNQTTSPVVQAPAMSSQSSRSRHSFMSEHSSAPGSLWSDGRRTTPPHNDGDPTEQPATVDFTPPRTQSQAIAEYLRSVRLTTLLKLTRPPHASVENPLVVSLSDLGSSKGYPLVIFLGLGGVRYVSGLYDDMAECLGIRLITIDR
jgi:hypothetical protein